MKLVLQLVIIPVQSAQPALFAGQLVQTFVPGLYCGGVVVVEHAVIAAQDLTPEVVTTARFGEAQPHIPAEGVCKVNVEVQAVHVPLGPVQVVQFRGQFVQMLFELMY